MIILYLQYLDYKQNYRDIFMFLNTSYNENTKISLYNDFYTININKKTHEISDYISKQNLKNLNSYFLIRNHILAKNIF